MWGMTRNVRILVVEAETPLAMLMVHLLTRAGCDVSAAPTGKRGMELAAETRFDLIVLDTRLPDVDGLEVCLELKQRHISRYTPIVFVSNHSNEEIKQPTLDAGAVDCITKPFEAKDFIFRILSQVEQTKKARTALEAVH